MVSLERLKRWTCRYALLLSAALPGCGVAEEDPAGDSTSAGESEEDGSTGGVAEDDGGTSESGALDSSSSGAASLPCAWVEGIDETPLPRHPLAASVVTCDPETDTATIQLVDDRSQECADVPNHHAEQSLVIRLPPELQAVGTYDISELTATIRVSADLEPVAGQVDTGTLIISEVTPTMVIGHAQGGKDGYDYSGRFEAPRCP